MNFSVAVPFEFEPCNQIIIVQHIISSISIGTLSRFENNMKLPVFLSAVFAIFFWICVHVSVWLICIGKLNGIICMPTAKLIQNDFPWRRYWLATTFGVLKEKWFDDILSSKSSAWSLLNYARINYELQSLLLNWKLIIINEGSNHQIVS